MATIRLTNAIREIIARDLIKHRFEEVVQNNMKERARMAELFYNAQFDAKERKFIASLPKGYLQEFERIEIVTGGDHYYCYFNGKCGHWDSISGSLLRKLEGEKDAIKKRFPHSYQPKLWAKSDPEMIQVEKTWNETKAIHENISDAQTKVMAALNQYYTVGGLTKEWPEIEPFVPRVARESIRTLPVLATKTLNTIFDLPVS